MKTLFVLLLLCLPVAALAQQGSALYEQRIQLQIELPPEMEAMRDRIPRENTSSHQLFFEGPVSLMKNVPQAEQNNPIEAESEGVRFRMITARTDDETYTDHDEHVQIERRDFLDRTFLITGTPPELAWRLTDERAEFLGYVSQKAVATTAGGASVEAWFTPEIPAPVGPAGYGGLPGLILVLSEGDGRRTFVAKEVSLEPLAEGTLQAPTRGRQVTREAFEAIVEERMRELGAERGRGAAVRMRIQN
jgi:GLPGLI family protein